MFGRTGLGKKIFSFAYTLGATFWATAAVASLQISPMRILFNDGDRAASVNLKHVGDKTTRYRISLHFYKFSTSGTLEEVNDPTLEKDRFAGPLLRYSPRMVTLEPGVTQSVRLLLRKDAELPQGEYRAHIEFQTFEEGDAELMGSGKQDKISMALKAHRAIAIPVVVRHGALQAKFSIANLRLANQSTTGDGPSLSVGLNREGSRSVYGDFAVELRPADGGSSKVIGRVVGASVYDGTRDFTVPLELGGQKLAKGDKLVVSFKDGDTQEEISREYPVGI